MATANPPRALKLRENPRLLEFKDLLYQLKPRYQGLIAKHFTTDKFYELALSTVGRNTDLLACSLTSVLRALIVAGQLGLDPTGVLGLAYVIPYKRTATLIIGYRGLMELARRSGEVVGIESAVVYASDIFKPALGTEPQFVHYPTVTGDRGEIIGAYAILRTKTGPPIHEWMTRADIDAIRKRARSGDTGPWSTDYAMMARKTTLRRLLKYAPLQIEEASKAAAVEDRFEEQGEDADLDDILPMPDLGDAPVGAPQTKADEMAERLRAATREEPVTSQHSQPEGSGAASPVNEDQTSLLDESS